MNEQKVIEVFNLPIVKFKPACDGVTVSSISFPYKQSPASNLKSAKNFFKVRCQKNIKMIRDIKNLKKIKV